MTGALNLGTSSTGVFYVRLETPAANPDLNPANNLYVVGNLVNSQPVETGPSLYFPLLTK